MCFYNNIKTVEKKAPTLIEDNLFTRDYITNQKPIKF